MKPSAAAGAPSDEQIAQEPGEQAEQAEQVTQGEGEQEEQAAGGDAADDALDDILDNEDNKDEDDEDLEDTLLEAKMESDMKARVRIACLYHLYRSIYMVLPSDTSKRYIFSDHFRACQTVRYRSHWLTTVVQLQ